MKAQDRSDVARPPLKWVGGKRAVLPAIRALMPDQFGAYWEPFLGGGAVFFGQQPRFAELSDVNAELIATYKAIRDQVESVIVGLERHADRHLHDLRRQAVTAASHDRFPHYYRVRAQDPAELPSVERAARMLYLNRTCFNGLYRVNRQGRFNVPAGSYAAPDIVQAGNLRACAAALACSTLAVRDFDAIEPAAGDFVYLDPPYDSQPGHRGFAQYAASGFNADDQTRVRDLAGRALDQGADVLVSNSDTPLIRWLYGRDRRFELHVVEAPRRVGRTTDSRRPVSELLIRGR